MLPTGRIRRLFPFDTEFSPDHRRRLACFQWGGVDLHTQAIEPARILHGGDAEAEDVFSAALADPEVFFIGQNTAIDMVVCGARWGLQREVMAAYDAGRVGDTMLRELMIALARPGREAWVKTEPLEGTVQSEQSKRGYRVWAKSRPSVGAMGRDPYSGGGSSVAKGLDRGKRRVSMEAIIWRRFGIDLAADKGPDGHRMKYGEYADAGPLESWPPGAVDYALQDVDRTIAPWLHQCIKPTAALDRPEIPWWRALTGTDDRALLFAHEAERARYAYILTEIECGLGFEVDPERATATRGEYWALEQAARVVLDDLGAISPKGAISGKMKLAEAHRLYDASDVPPDLTDTGRKKIPDSEGTPLRKWPEAGRKYVSTAGSSVGWVLDPQSDDAKTAIGNAVNVRTWPAERVQRAIYETASPLLAANVIASKAHNYGGVIDKFLEGPAAHPRYDPLKDTGRISSRAPLTQAISREGGVRECLRAREGHVLLIADYAQIELVLFAWLLDRITEIVCGYPADSYQGPLTKAINAGQDAHILLGLRLMRLDPTDAEHDRCKALRKRVEGILEELGGDKAAAKVAYPDLAWSFAIDLLDNRQKAKAGNYGFLGGMGPRGFMRAQAKQGGLFTYGEAATIRALWKDAWLTDPYFEFISELEKKGRRLGTGICLRVPGSGLIVGGRRYTQAANILFQGMAAQLLALAVRRVWGSCWGESDRNPRALEGGRIVHLVHDEIIAEAPDRGPEANAEALAELRHQMVAPADQLVPGLAVQASGSVVYGNWRKC